jgi:hypothetical protein
MLVFRPRRDAAILFSPNDIPLNEPTCMQCVEDSGEVQHVMRHDIGLDVTRLPGETTLFVCHSPEAGEREAQGKGRCLLRVVQFRVLEKRWPD